MSGPRAGATAGGGQQEQSARPAVGSTTTGAGPPRPRQRSVDVEGRRIADGPLRQGGGIVQAESEEGFVGPVLGREDAEAGCRSEAEPGVVAGLSKDDDGLFARGAGGVQEGPDDRRARTAALPTGEDGASAR